MSRRQYTRKQDEDEEDEPIPERRGLDNPSLFSIGFFIGIGFLAANVIFGGLIALIVWFLLTQ